MAVYSVHNKRRLVHPQELEALPRPFAKGNKDNECREKSDCGDGHKLVPNHDEGIAGSAA